MFDVLLSSYLEEIILHVNDQELTAGFGDGDGDGELTDEPKSSSRLGQKTSKCRMMLTKAVRMNRYKLRKL